MVDAVDNRFVYNPTAGYGCGYYDIDDLDLNYTTYPTMGCSPCGAMGMGSIFDPMMGSMGMMGMGAYNNQSYFDNMRDYQRFNNEYYLENQRMQRNMEFQYQAPMEAIQSKYTILKDKITRGESGQITQAYEDFVQAVGAAYGNGSNGEIRARAATTYKYLNGGKSIIDDLRENGHGAFTQALLNTATFGLYGPDSSEDNISAITGAPVGKYDKTKKVAGKIAGATAVGVAAPFAISALAAGLTKSFKAVSKKGGIIGLVAAGAALLVSTLCNKKD